MADTTPVSIGDAAINLNADALVLRFPTGRFRDVYVDGLTISPKASDAGLVRVRPWSIAEVGRYWDDVDRFRRYGRPVAWVIRKAGRDASGSGLVQRAAWRLSIPLREPADRHAVVTNCMIRGSYGR